jgi:hypothetical protein
MYYKLSRQKVNPKKKHIDILKYVNIMFLKAKELGDA